MRYYILTAFFSLALSFAIKTASAQSTATANVDGVNYKAILYGDQSISIKDGTKTVFRARRADLYLTFEPFFKMEFKDFNGDGYPDLLVEYRSNVPGKCDLMLYDKLTKKFVQVNGFPEYPTSEKIVNTPFFYSYRKSGCADLDWNSDLYKIINFKIVVAANMEGRGCENSGEALGIYLYKLVGKKQHLANKLPITELNTYKGNKQEFIDNYWKANYSKF